MTDQSLAVVVSLLGLVAAGIGMLIGLATAFLTH